jgi:hypothetical protein
MGLIGKGYRRGSRSSEGRIRAEALPKLQYLRSNSGRGFMMIGSIRALALSILITGLLLTCAFCSENGTIRVELDAFSGRENPSWNMTSDEGDFFIRSLESLNKTGAEFADAGLGYRGLLVKGLKGYDRVSVYDGVVLAQSGNSSSGFEDKGRSLELWLMRTGKDSLDGELYSQILSEIEAGK